MGYSSPRGTASRSACAWDSYREPWIESVRVSVRHMRSCRFAGRVLFHELITCGLARAHRVAGYIDAPAPYCDGLTDLRSFLPAALLILLSSLRAMFC